jgi:hypothetical protein
MLTNRAVEGLYFKDVLYHTVGNEADAVLAAARGRMLLLGVVLGGCICAWAWRLAGAGAGIVALAFFCFDPNFLAHSALVKNDVPESLVLLVFAVTIWPLGRGVTALRGIGVCLALAAALTVKFSGVLAIPVLAIALVIRAVAPQAWPFFGRMLQSRRRRVAAAVSVFVVACAFSYGFIWACYGFRYSPGRDASQLFDFNELLQIARTHDWTAASYQHNPTPAEQEAFYANWHPGLVLRLGFWANEHHLLPQTWVEGFLFTYGTAPGRAAFLLGENAMLGRWYYFPIAMLVKTPLATIVAFVVAAGYWIGNRFSGARWWDVVCLTLLPVVYFVTAIFSDLNLGIRHVLPIYPFLFILLGITAADAIRRFGRIAAISTVVLLFGLGVESAAAYPDFIPFFNIAAGGWQNGANLLGDSNVDWGQDLPAIAQWQSGHPQYQLFLAYFGSADPRYYGIHFIKLPGGQGPDDETVADSRPRIYAVSANVPNLAWLTDQDRAFYKSLERQKPVAVLGHCIYLYNPPAE